jgi:large subunit ribosomal protein L13
MRIKTWTPKAADVDPKWWVVDAEGKTLGRLASEIARVLRGKHKPTYTTHMDMGDYVVVVNCEKIHTSADRVDTKVYYRHSGYPGGLRSITLREQLKKRPERVIELAVKGMLPKNRLGKQMFKKLKVYAGPNHPHEAQKPEVLEIEVY